MAEPVYQRLRERYPRLTIDVLAPAWTQAIHERMSAINDIILNPFNHGELRLFERWKLSQTIKVRKYNQAIVFPNSFKSALLPFLSGIPLRTGYLGEARYGLLNDIRHLDAQALPKMVDRFMALADPLHSGLSQTPYPRLTANLGNLKATLKCLNLKTQPPIIALCPGAEYGPAKRWPAHHVARLANLLFIQGMQVWIFGSNKEIAIGEDIVKSAPDAINLCGKTNLGQATDLLSLATAVVTNDSGLMHIAAALGRPLVAVYGSSSTTFTPPLSDHAKIVSLELACSPCFQRTCPLLHMKCLNDLLPEHVYAVLQTLIPTIIKTAS